MRHVQSNRSFSLDEPLGFLCNVQTVAGGGGGPTAAKSRKVIAIPNWLKRKRSVIDPQVQDGLCLLAALRLCVELQKGRAETKRLNKRTGQLRREAMDYLVDAELTPGMLTMADLRLLSQSVSELRGHAISVFEVGGKRQTKIDGPLREFYLLLHDGHYYALVTPTALVAQGGDYCTHCGKTTRKGRRHKCDAACCQFCMNPMCENDTADGAPGFVLCEGTAIFPQVCF